VLCAVCFWIGLQVICVASVLCPVSCVFILCPVSCDINTNPPLHPPPCLFLPNTEHEKDHVYKYLPYLLATSVYYGFHFLCPGSRHLYTKGFRKTILMQIVQLMNGIQLCPISIKGMYVYG